jgi:putative tryptophan/tyrosine transport system substrate-binding protein
MKKRVFQFALSALLFALGGRAEAQQTATIPTIGLISGASLSATANRIEALRQGLRALGYMDGKTITIEMRFAEGKMDLLDKFATELVRLKVDAIVVAGGEPVALAVKRATQSIPVVMANAFDPVASGLVESLARPGGNITGLTSLTGPEIIGKQTEIIRDTIPKLSRLGLLINPTNSFSKFVVKEIEAAASMFSLALFRADARNLEEFDAAFAVFGSKRVEALFVMQDPMFIDQLRRLVQLETKYRLAAMHSSPEYVEAGSLMSYGTDRTDLFRRAATYVDKILKGAKPAELPVEQPTKFEFVINLKTAKQIGVTIPPNVLVRADKVIK